MVKEVILVKDEWHGVIGVAEDYITAVACVEDWLGGWKDFYDGEERVLTDEEIKSIFTLGIEKFNELLDGYFCLETTEFWYKEDNLIITENDLIIQ